MLLLFILLPLASAAIDPSICDCFQTSASSYFTNYTFHDFRSLPLSPIPPAVDSYNADQDLQSGYLSSSAWSDIWGIQDWGKHAQSDESYYDMRNAQNNIFLDTFSSDTEGSNTTSKLVFRARRTDDVMSTAEVENLQKNLFYASIRIRARVLGDKGVVAGLFTYRNKDNECDIEILTKAEKQQIYYSNQPVVDDDGNEIEGASTQVDLSTDVKTDGTDLSFRKRKNEEWTDWHTHRLDWEDGVTTWYLDGVKKEVKTYSVPNVSSYFVMNLWSDGGMWSGNMSVGAEARMEVLWVEMVYNTSGPVTDDEDGAGPPAKSDEVCDTVCVLDEKNAVEGGIASAGVRMSVGSLLLGTMAAGCLWAL